jgi:antagonist of KipI
MEILGARRPHRETNLRAIRVLSAGLLTTVQDTGRRLHARFGVPPSGAADSFSARLANRLAGNDDLAALLEMTASGAEISFEAPAAAGVAGAPMPVRLNDREISRAETIYLLQGDVLSFGSAPSGMRSYLAVSGGIDVPVVLGSRSTHLAANFGGFHGRKIEKGDQLFFGETQAPVLRKHAGGGIVSGDFARVRTLPGPQETEFPAAAAAAFYRESFRVSAQSNRMGLRLEGERIGPDGPEGIETEGSSLGSVQVPSSGQPIILMPEGPVTGGYPKIACVIRADWPLLGQLRPGQEVGFEKVTEEEALAALRERESLLEEAR